MKTKKRPSQERLKEMFHYDPDTGIFTRRKPSARARENSKFGNVGAGRISEYGYVLLMIDSVSYIAGSLAWLYVNGEWPSGKVHYVNGNKLDNRFENIGVYSEGRDSIKSREMTAKRLKELLHYEPETGWFTWRVNSSTASAGERAGGGHGLGYRSIGLDYKKYLEHRLAWLYMVGDWPRSEIDHINQVKSDNRWRNLREATRAENNANQPQSRKVRNSLGYTGVHVTGEWYKASICIDSKTKYLGRFKTLAQARIARLLAEKKHRGSFVSWNLESDSALPFGGRFISILMIDNQLRVVLDNGSLVEVTDAAQIEALPANEDGVVIQ